MTNETNEIRSSKENVNEFNTLLARKMQDLKKSGLALRIQQGYKGTGSKIAHRQIWVSLSKQAFQGSSVDVWLENGSVRIGGVVRNSKTAIPIVTEGLTVNEVFVKIEERIKEVKQLNNL